MGRTRDLEILARTIYGEARGENFEGQIAVAWVVCNRYKAQKKIWGYTIEEVCQKPWQFSCWNDNDPNRGKALAATFVDDAYVQAYGIACLVLLGKLPDFSNGATHYHSTQTVPPTWAAALPMTAHVGKHIFYKEE
jgi:spore germination cell wall hydrolase CwlJ-like protein